MGKINPNAPELINNYIVSKDPFIGEICTLLRAMILGTNTKVVED
jgi:hypothetical protein